VLKSVCKNTIFLILVFLLFHFELGANTNSNAAMAAASQARNSKLSAILLQNYNFKFNTADSLLNNYEKEAGSSSDILLARSTILWWKIISEKNSILKNKYTQNLSEAEKLLFKERSKNENEFLYKAISLYGFGARMDGLEKNYFKAILKINNCLKYITKTLGKEENFIYFYLSSGLYNYYTVNTEDAYPLIVPYLSLYPKGNLDQGIKYLQVAANTNDVVLSTEANYFLMKIYLDKKNYSEAEKYCSKLVTKYPSNLLFLYYNFILLLKQDNLYKAKVFMARIKIAAKNNTQLSEVQRKYFYDMADDDIKNYEKDKKTVLISD
jgi:hypothetical protein